MVSSTAAKSSMSLICAQSYPCNLAFECVRQLSNSCKKIKGVISFKKCNILEFRSIRLWFKRSVYLIDITGTPVITSPSNNHAQASLLAANNIDLLMRHRPGIGRNFASLNKAWLRLLPPGLQTFVDQNCW